MSYNLADYLNDKFADTYNMYIEEIDTYKDIKISFYALIDEITFEDVLKMSLNIDNIKIETSIKVLYLNFENIKKFKQSLQQEISNYGLDIETELEFRR